MRTLCDHAFKTGSGCLSPAARRSQGRCVYTVRAPPSPRRSRMQVHSQALTMSTRVNTETWPLPERLRPLCGLEPTSWFTRTITWCFNRCSPRVPGRHRLWLVDLATGIRLHLVAQPFAVDAGKRVAMDVDATRQRFATLGGDTAAADHRCFRLLQRPCRMRGRRSIMPIGCRARAYKDNKGYP